MNSDKITFVIPARNNLEFLKIAYESIRRLETQHDILILNDASIDGTQEWIDSLNDSNLITYVNEGPDRIGIVGMFDKGIEMARTEIIMAFHADMVVCKNFDVNILKHLKKGTVVSATRVEPPLHPSGVEKITHNLGIEVEDFEFDDWYEVSEKLKESKQTEGIFAPWCMYKEDFLNVGGHDELFAPQSKEDSDLFNRFSLAGYKFIQPWDALVYHFTSRGSRFNKYSGGDAGKNSQEWLHTTTKNMRNFIRKWGSIVLHDAYMKPIVIPKYNIEIRLINAKYELLQLLEPWCDVINLDLNQQEIDNYIISEQQNTTYDLSKRINIETDSDIIINVDGNTLNNELYTVIQNLSRIVQDSGDVGTFDLAGLKVQIKRINEYQLEYLKR
jgi:glycosyltransferase involved in cell wall biosynthesis